MARKERNSVDYFPHEVSHGKKMFYLRDKYKNDGYAVWFMLLEELGKSDYHYLDLKDEVQLMYLSAEFKVSEVLLLEIIETLVKFNEFDCDLWVNEKILFNQKFIDNISDAYKKRNNSCIDINSLSSLLMSKGRIKQSKSNLKQVKSTLKGCDNTQTILKESKLNKTKEDNTKKKEVAYAEIYPTFEDFWEEYDKKVGKKEKIKSKWDLLGQTEKEKIMTYIPDYKISQPNKKYRKNPETFLNNESWNDEIIIFSEIESKQAQKNNQTIDVFKKNIQGWN